MSENCSYVRAWEGKGGHLFERCTLLWQYSHQQSVDWKIYVSVINHKIDTTYVHMLHCGTVDINNTKTAFNIKKSGSIFVSDQ